MNDGDARIVHVGNVRIRDTRREKRRFLIQTNITRFRWQICHLNRLRLGLKRLLASGHFHPDGISDCPRSDSKECNYEPMDGRACICSPKTVRNLSEQHSDS